MAQTYNPIGMWLPFSGIGLLGLALATSEDDAIFKKELLKRIVIAGTVLLIAFLLLMATSCGSYGNRMNNMNNGTASFLVTGTSGAVMHSMQVSLTVQ